MMKYFKRFLSLICALAMLISIAGSYADLNEGETPAAPAAEEPASNPEPAPNEGTVPEPEANEPDQDPEGDDSSEGDSSNPEEEPGSEEPSGSEDESDPEEPSGSEENPSEEDSRSGGEQPAGQQGKPSDDEKPSGKEQTDEDGQKPNESKADEPKQEDENWTTAGQETSDPSAAAGTAEQGSPAENETESKDSQASEQSGSDPNASAQNLSGENVSEQNASGLNGSEQNGSEPEETVQETNSASGEEQNDEEDPKDDPEAEDSDEDQTGLNVLEIGGSVKKGTVVPDEPVRLVMRSERTETILLTAILAAGDEIRLTVNSRELSFAESNVDEETGEQTLIYPLEAKTGNAYLLEIAADKETEFSIQAAYREMEAPKEEEPSEGEENKEQTEVQNDDSSDENPDKSKDSENEKVNQPAKDGQPAAEGDHPADQPAADETNGAEAGSVPLSEGGTLIAPGSDYTVTVQYGADALFPVNVTLTVTEIHPWDARYAEMTGITEEMLTDDWSEAGDFQRVFDITFRSGETEIEPAAPIQVDIQFHDPVTLEENSSLQVVHVDHENNAEIVPNDTAAAPAEGNSAVEVEGVSFTSDSFSTYIVFQKKEVVSKTIESEDHSVAITYGRENGIPANSRVSVTEIAEGTEAYETFRRQLIRQLNLDETKQTVLFSALYDITILDEHSNEVTIQDNTTVTVTAELPADTARQEDLLVVHFEDNGEGANELSAATENNTVTFETDGFSVYGFAYTVDYTFENREYHMQGETSMLLSELFEKLGIDAEARNALQVSFTDDSLLSVKKTEDDWLLTSLKPFTSHETLTVTMNDGTVYVVKVTDAQSSTDLRDFLTEATINAPTDENGNYVVLPGSSYSIILSFKETPSLQFANTSLTYPIPAGLDANGHSGIFTVSISRGGNIYAIQGNQYAIANNVLTVTWNQSDPNYKQLTASANLQFALTFKGRFSETATKILFSDGIEKAIEIDTSNSVTTSKTAYVDIAHDRVNYTATVTSAGTSRNVVITDTITGTGLTLDSASIHATSSKTGVLSNLTGSASGNSFSYTIPEMTNGEIITFRYSASIDPSVLEKINGKVVTQSGNTFKATSEGDPDGHSTTVNNTIDYTPGIQKSNGTVTGSNGTVQTMKWSLTVNPEPKVSAAGTIVTDTIAEAARSYMKYSGTGLTIKVYDAIEQLIRTDNKSWTELGVNNLETAGSWEYTIPDADQGHPYQYVIEYTTDVETKDLTQVTTVVNTGTTTGGKESSGSGQVIPANGEVKIHKEVSEIDRANKTVTWNISFTVPKTGLNKAEVTDTYPSTLLSSWVYEKVRQNGTLTVTGLMSGESYSVKYGETEAVITFTKDGTTPGLNPSDSVRTIQITLQTEINDAWVAESMKEGLEYKISHTNYVKLDYETGMDTDSATASITGNSIHKQASIFKTRNIDGTDLPIYQFEIVLFGVESDQFEIVDTFDTDILEIYTVEDSPNFPTNRILFGGTKDSQINRGETPVSYLNTENGIKFQVTPESIPKDSNHHYYTAYKLVYYLTVKDRNALMKLTQRAAAEGDGTYDITNSATWNGQTDTTSIAYAYNGLKKEILTQDSELSKTDQDIWVDFKITLNPAAQMLNGGSLLVLEDTVENLSVDITSIQATPSAGVSWEMHGKKVTYTIPDATAIVITYRARVIYTSIGNPNETISVNFSNHAEMSGYSGDVNNTAYRTNKGTGSGTVPGIKLMKYSAGDMTRRLSGAVFALLDQDKKPVKDKNGKAVTFTTDANGMIFVEGDQERDGWALAENTRYYLRETKAPEGYKLANFDYSFQISSDGTTDYSNYIYYSGDTMSAKNYPGTQVPVTKVWEDGADKHSNDSVTVQLMQTIGENGTPSSTIYYLDSDNKWQTQEMTLTLDADNEWTGMFTDLPLVYDANEDDPQNITYSIAEVASPEGYTSSVSGDAKNGYTITNTRNQVTETSASVMKLWMDDGNADGARPVSLPVRLLADGTVLQTVTLSENNQWRATVEHLPVKKAHGSGDIVYSWEETEPDGYVLSGTLQQGTITVLINTRIPELMDIPVRKVWEDNGNAAQTRPEAVTVQLFANGTARGEAIVLNAANNWESAWTGLPKAEGGAAIRYTVEEIDAPVGYETAVSGSAETGFTVTNTLQQGGIVIEKEFNVEIPAIRPAEEPEYREITVSKVWADNGNPDGNRPDSVTVRLYAGGTEVAAAQITAGEGWQHTFQGLPARVNGRAIHYSVSEDTVPLYVSTVNGFTITNTYRPETTAAAVTKIWNDGGNELNLRPQSVRVTLSNGQETVAHVMLSEENGWSAAVSGLSTIVSGREAEYTWTEEPVIGYDQESVTQQGSRTIITNKVWEREAIPDNMKPKRTPGNTFYIFEDYDTPLGVEIMINHVGDCFD